MASAPTHYEALSVAKEATAEQLKQAYHAALLQHHPDKVAASGSAAADGGGGGGGRSTSPAEDAFARVQLAWEVLRDPGRRAAYDAELSLRAQRSLPVSYQDELELDEMDEGSAEEGGDAYTYPCRCGDVYVLLRSELPGHTTIVVPCRTCSNHVLVKVAGG